MADFDDLEIEFDLDLDPQSLTPTLAAIKKQIADMAGEFDLVKKEIATAKKQLQNLGDQGKKTGEELGDGHQTFGRRAKTALVHVVDGWNRVRDTAMATAAAVVGVLNATKSIGESLNVLQAMSPVDRAAIEAANKALGGTVDKLTLAKTLQATNLSADLFGPAAKSAAFMAKQFGPTKAHMLDAIHNGTLMETQLQALGISTKHLDNEVAKVEASFGGVGGEIDDVTKSNIRAKVTIEAIRKASKNFTADTKQTGDEAAKVLAEFKNVSLELGRAILPTLNKIIKVMTVAAKWAAARSKSTSEDLDKKQAEFFLQDKVDKKHAAFFAQKNAADRVALTQTKQQAHSQTEIKQGLAAIFATAKKYMPLAKAIGGIAKDQAKAGLKAAEAAGKAIALEKAKAAQLSRQKRIREELVRQAIEERRQLQEQAKDFLRNSVEKQIQTIADMGGSFGEVASGLTDLPEKFRIFSSLPSQMKGINAAIKVAAEFQGQKNIDIGREIDLRKESLGLSNSQAKTAKLLGMWIQGSALDSLEYLGNEKAANAALKAGLSDLQGRAKLAQIINEKNNAQKDITQFAASAEAAKNVFMGRQSIILEKLVGARGHQKKQLEAELKLNFVMIQRLGKTVKQFRVLGEERAKYLEIQKQIAHLEIAAEVRQKSIDARKGQLDDTKRISAIRDELRAATGAIDGDGAASVLQAASFRIQEIKLEMAGLASQAKLLKGKIDGGLFVNKDDAARAQRDLAGLQARLGMRNEEIRLIGLKTAAEIEGMTFVGRLRQLYAADAINLQVKMAESLHGSFNSLIGGFSQTVLGAFEALAQGEQDIGSQVGKGFLDALAGVAAQLGAVFIAAGIGKLALFDPSGFIALGAGTTLLGIAGGLKAASGLVSAPSPGASAGRSISAPTTPTPQTGPGATPVREIRETIILPVASWLGSVDGQRRSFERWKQNTNRSTRARGGGRF